MNSINLMQTNYFFVLQYLNSLISLIGGGCVSDFLSFQILAGSEQTSSFSNFLFECVFLILVTHMILIVVSLGLLYCY